MTEVLIKDSAVAARLIEQRRAAGVDLYDEVWQGVYHVNPVGRWVHGRTRAQLIALLMVRAGERVAIGPMNLGVADDYRIPDASLLEGPRPDDEVYTPTALLVAEVRSPGDDTYEKFAFYAERGVQEVLVARPEDHAVDLYRRAAGEFVQASRSELLGMTADEIGAAVRW